MYKFNMGTDEEAEELRLSREPMDTDEAYPAVVVSIEEKMGGSGFPYLQFTFEAQYHGHERKVKGNLSASPKARVFVGPFLEGIRPDLPIPDRGEFDMDPHEYLHKSCRVKIKHREWTNGDGETIIFNDVAKILPTDTDQAPESRI